MTGSSQISLGKQGLRWDVWESIRDYSWFGKLESYHKPAWHARQEGANGSLCFSSNLHLEFSDSVTLNDGPIIRRNPRLIRVWAFVKASFTTRFQRKLQLPNEILMAFCVSEVVQGSNELKAHITGTITPLPIWHDALRRRRKKASHEVVVLFSSEPTNELPAKRVSVYLQWRSTRVLHHEFLCARQRQSKD